MLWCQKEPVQRVGRKTHLCLQLLQGEETAGSRSCCAGPSFLPADSLSHTGTSLLLWITLGACPARGPFCFTRYWWKLCNSSVVSARREGMLLAGVCISFPTRMCSGSQDLSVCAWSVGFGLRGDCWAPRMVLFLLLISRHPTMKDDTLLKSRNLWDQICAFSLLQHL